VSLHSYLIKVRGPVLGANLLPRSVSIPSSERFRMKGRWFYCRVASQFPKILLKLTLSSKPIVHGRP